MRTGNELSPRENEIVELSIEGLTNDAIAHRLGLSVGTINTYWIRIKLKMGASGRTDAVANVVKQRAELECEEAKVDWQGLQAILAKREILDLLVEKEHDRELRTMRALLQIAVDKIQATVWATDSELSIKTIFSEDLPLTHFGVEWQEGLSIYDVFKTTDREHPAVAAHIDALAGAASDQKLDGEFSNMLLRVLPFEDEHGKVTCCVSILYSVGDEATPHPKASATA